MAIRFRYALHVETDLIHVWPSKAARTHDIGFESDCWRDGWRPLPSWEARPLMGSLTGETRHMAFMVGAWAGMHPECAHCTVRPTGTGAGGRPGDTRRLAGRRIPSDARKGTEARWQESKKHSMTVTGS